MTLVKIMTDANGEVVATGWANPKQRKAGDLTADGFTVYDFPQADIDACVIGHTKVAAGRLVIDADYTAPTEPAAVSQPDAEQQMINALGLQVASLQKQVATLTQGNTAPAATSTAATAQGAAK